MSEQLTGENYLLIDIGHVLTRVAYIGVVEGTARLLAVAESTMAQAAGAGRLLDGIRRAVANLEALVGCKLLDSNGDLRRPADSAGHGINGVLPSTSLAPPLRVALVGLTRDLSLASAIRASAVPYVTLERIIALEESSRRWETEDLQSLVETPPDAIVLVGGIDGAPQTAIRDLGEALSAAYSLLPENARPAVVYSGNREAQRTLVASFTGVADLHVTANVRPSLTQENLGGLRNELARLFHGREISESEDLRTVSRWASANVSYGLDATARTLRFAARRQRFARGILGIDIGGNGTRLLLVRPEGVPLTWATPYGTGMGVAALRKVTDPTAIVRWMQHPLSWAEVWDRLSNVEVRPAGVPQSAEDWDLQQATACEALCRSWSAAQEAWAGYVSDSQSIALVDMIVAQGTALSHAQTSAQAALILMNALQPAGLLRLSLDWANLLPGLAGLAQLNARAALEVNDNDALLELGTLVAPMGSARKGAPAIRARLTLQGETRAEVTVPAGSIRRLPLGVNEYAKLELVLARGLDLGLDWRGRGGSVEVRGGALGVIIDARGRPLILPAEETAGRSVMETWQREIEEA